MNAHVYISSYLVIFIALKKLKITICAYMAGSERDSASKALMPSSSPLSVSDLDATMPSKTIAKTIITPKNIAILNEVINSISISSVFRLVDLAIVTSEPEKNPIATTVRKEISAHASDA
ncbi:hypothetical protein LOY55_11835 [Pseudomonas sp. B21-040]|uniref:hypothetical protein n=1 Tax=Pseudomonas sp. B21-040 TaxID=2895486 RepID=UPI002160BD7F|nr:hypothetical protein [Pseudomonas sp. B21-040]UVL43673.1 hypothetical protein LOY55_11835 [Pseudomonas sp. B21-040]